MRVELAKIAQKYSSTKDEFFNVWFDLLKCVGDPLAFDDGRFREVISSLSKL